MVNQSIPEMIPIVYVELLKWYGITETSTLVFANGASLQVHAGEYYPILFGSVMTRKPMQIVGRQP